MAWLALACFGLGVFSPNPPGQDYWQWAFHRRLSLRLPPFVYGICRTQAY